MIERDSPGEAGPRARPGAGRGAGYLIALAAALVCPHPVAAQIDRERLAEVEALAATVEIVRDTYGVPHIYGPTDASVVFGEAWAEAEDNWWQVEDNFIRSIGRAAELYGEEAVADDYVARAMRIESRSRAEYEAAAPGMKRLYDAYAAGFNLWLIRNPRAARLLERVEPWYAIALIRFKYHHNEYIGYAGLQRPDIARLVAASRIPEPKMEEVELAARPAANLPAHPPSPPGSTGSPVSGASPAESPAAVASGSIGVSRMQLAGAEWPAGERPLGSNEWAVSGARTASGAPMLLINPHVGFFGLSQYNEVHLESEEGLVFSGLSRYGFMLPYMGHSRHLGWAYTDNYADIGDIWVETIEWRAGRPVARHGEAWREVETWEESIAVLVRGEIERREFRFLETSHGPVLGLRRTATGGESVGPMFENGLKPLAVRVSKLDEDGWYEQWYDMMRADGIEAWREAVSRLVVPYQNTMYADVDGNIHYIYNVAVPRRSTEIDWSEPVDGRNPAAEWDGYHTLDELPQVLNPSSGYLQNTNSTPFMATEGLELRREDYPPYLVGGETDNFRAQSSRRVLETLEGLTLDAFAAKVLDTRMSAADELLPSLFDEIEELFAEEPVRADALLDPVESLRDWDRHADIGSEATTLFVRWAERLEGPAGRRAPRWRLVDALETAVAGLEKDWGTWRVAWGEVNRLQRPDAAGDEPFSDDAPSLPVPGAPGWLGSVFTFHTQPAPNGKRRYGVHGNSFVKVIEFVPGIRARSILTFGQSGDPDSPHYLDQAPLYAGKRFKSAWFSRAEVDANAERTYAPGMPDR